MNRVIVCATLVCAVLTAACGSDSTSPKNQPFTGTFVGSWTSGPSITDTAHMTQSGNSITARDSEYLSGSLSGAVNFNGSVTGTTMTFTVSNLAGDTTYGTFKGTYTTSAVVSGYYYAASSPTDSQAVSWTKQ
jgi:hypothetical protein